MYPNTSVKGCRFYDFGHARFRKIQSLGLASEDKDKSTEIGKWGILLTS